MFAEGGGPLLRGLYYAYGLGLGIVVFLAGNLQVHDVSRYDIGHEDHHVIYAHQCLSFCRYVGYLHLLQQGELFLFSCHKMRFGSYFSAKLPIIFEKKRITLCYLFKNA